MDVNVADDFENPFTDVEAIKVKLEHWKERQRRRRRVLLQDLSKEHASFIGVSELGDEELSRLLIRILGNRKSHLCVDEYIHKKRAILPVISRLRAPSISPKLLSKIQSLLTHRSPAPRETKQIAQQWDKFSLEVIGDKLRQSLANNEASAIDSDRITSLASVSKNSEDSSDLIVETCSASTAFLKGTQSANPHNDYCQHFVDTGERPQNFIRDTGLKNRFEEYPKLRELIRLKDQLIQSKATPPMYLRADLRTFDLNDLQSKFDVILIEPPLEEYHRMNGAIFDQYWSWDEIERLAIDQIAAPRSFVWIWCGSGEGLDAARLCLRKWGFRRCEDICWIKTNTNNPGHEALEPNAVFQRTKEHCLMGIHGTVRRSTDGDFIHANIDIDLIIEEAPQHGGYAAKDKPTEIFHIIEHFCLGRRRLHLFGRDSTLRAGWLTVGSELSASNFDARLYASNFTKDPTGLLLGTTEEVERLRPKSPPPRHPNPTSTGPTGTANPLCPIPDVCQTICPTPGLAPGGHLVHPLPNTNTVGQVESATVSLIGPNLSSHGNRRFISNSGPKTITPSNLQPSLLGLPSSVSQLTSNRTGLRDESSRPSFNLHNNTLLTGPSSSRRNLGSAQTQQQNNPLATGTHTSWPNANNLAMALAAAAAAAASRSLPVPSLGPQTSALRTQVSDTPLIASLLASGKLNPAVLNMFSPTTTGSASSSLNLLNNLLRGNLQLNKHQHGSWR